MAKIPVRFKRVAAVFYEVRESSGSDHSAESLTDLSDLVNSFLEREISKVEGEFDRDQNVVGRENEMVMRDESDQQSESKNCSGYNKSKDVLKSLLVCHDDEVKRKIHAAVENASSEAGDSLSPDFRRRLMARLRQRGFDAGICKSKWEKTGKCPSGEHEYIDVLDVAGSRYIVEISLAKEFEIARPTARYEALLDNFPTIFVGKKDELKQIVKLMCNSIRKSMKSKEMYVPPWRRHYYVQAKWFSSYKRTINDVPAKKESNSDEFSRRKRSVGFVPLQGVSNYLCKEDFAAKIGVRVGNLAAALNDGAIVL